MFVFLLNGRLKHHADAPLRLAAARPWLDDTDGCAPRGSSATLCCTPVCSPHHMMGSTSMCFLYEKRHSDWGGVSQTQLVVPRRRVACSARRARRSAATAHARSHARHRGHAPATRTIGLAQSLTASRQAAPCALLAARAAARVSSGVAEKRPQLPNKVLKQAERVLQGGVESLCPPLSRHWPPPWSCSDEIGLDARLALLRPLPSKAAPLLYTRFICAPRPTSPVVTPFAPGHSTVTPRRLQTPPPPPPPPRWWPSTAGGMSLPEAALVVAALPSRHLSSGLRGPATLRVAVLPAPPCSSDTPRSGRLHRCRRRRRCCHHRYRCSPGACALAPPSVVPALPLAAPLLPLGRGVRGLAARHPSRLAHVAGAGARRDGC